MRKPSPQAMFFGRIADPRDVLRMFEHTPDTFVFVKDEEGRFMAANRATCARCGASNESELIGSTDEKFLPPEIARSYREDDKRVFRTGKAIVNRLELFYDEQRRLDWFLTTKLPLRDQRGRVIGVMGMTRRAEQRTMHESVREVVAAVDFAREHCNRVSTTAEMADALCLSERHLHRKLREALGLSPYELMLRARVQSAANALAQTSRTISEIASDHGFCDQSAFTQQFRKRTGHTPREFRAIYQR